MDLGRPSGAQPITAKDVDAGNLPQQQANTQPQYQQQVTQQPAQQPQQQYQQPAQQQYQAPVQQPAQHQPVQSVTAPQISAPSDQASTEVQNLRQELDNQKIYTAAGGKDQFDKMAAWAPGNMPEDTRQLLNKTLQNKDTPFEIKEFIVRDAMRQFSTATQPQQQQAQPLLQGDASFVNAQQPTVEPITQKEFYQSVVELARQGKNTYSPEYKALVAQRHAGIKLG